MKEKGLMNAKFVIKILQQNMVYLSAFHADILPLNFGIDIVNEFINTYALEIPTELQVKRHKCDFCESAFNKKVQLKKHFTAAHEGIKFKPYNCDICGNRFSSKPRLRGHISTIHEKIIPYVCVLCKKAFAQKSNLSVHVSSVHK